MNNSNFMMAISLFLSSCVVAAVGGAFWYNQTQAMAHSAIDNCMQNSRFKWQEKVANSEQVNSNEEPNRFWYKFCIEEKGYSIKTELK